MFQTNAPQEAQSSDLTASEPKLGGEIRSLRKAKRMTLRELANASGRTAGYLSQVENGVVAPSLETVTRIAKALKVETNWFFPHEAGHENRERNLVVREASRRRLSHMYSFDTTKLGYQDFLLSADLSLGLCMGLSRYEPDGRTRGIPSSSEGHICGFVQKGEVKLIVEDMEFHLVAGDSFSFDLSRTHDLRNEHSDTSEVIWAITPLKLDF